MKAIVIHEHGGREVLRLEDVPDPSPKAGEVLVEVRASALNHLDIWVRRGIPGVKYPLPLIPGNDVAGTVREVGDGVTDTKPGDDVVVVPGICCGKCAACLDGRDNHCKRYGILGESRDGGWAEKIVVPRENVLPRPARLSFEEAASIPLAFYTAWHMLVTRARLRRGETVLVHAGGSGVGSAAIQIAKIFDAMVITTVGSAEKAEKARELGADHTILYREEDFAATVKQLTEKRGADVVFEHVGEATWSGSMRALAWQGRIVTCGATTGAEVTVNLQHLFFKQQSILGSTMGTRADLCDVLAHVEAGRLAPVVGKILPLAEAAEAHRLAEEREVFGKIVLVP